MTTIRACLQRSSRGLLVTLVLAGCLIAAATSGVPVGAATTSGRISRSEEAHLARLFAPHLKLVGHRLIWSRVDGVRTYLFARLGPGRRSTYRVVAKTSVVPKPVPGAAVRYTVKTNINGSAWASPVTIVFNRLGAISKISGLRGSGPGKSGSGSGSSSSGSGSSGSGSSGSGIGRSGPVELGGSLEELASRPRTALKVGLIGGVTGWGPAASETVRDQTGVKYTRTSPAVEGWGSTRELVSEGITPLVLYNPELAGMSPATVAEALKSYLPVMRELGLSEIELGNEVYYHGSTPVSYAAQYRAAHEALVGSSVTLIADGGMDAIKPNGEWSQWESGGGWNVMVVEALGYVPDAWSVHPYGPMNADGFGDAEHRPGWMTVPRMIAYMKADHIYAPLSVTEVGQPTYEGTDGNTPVTEAEQAADVRQYLTQAAEWGLASIYLYEGIDTGEGGYGLYKWPLQAKPSAAVFAETLAKLTAA
jgi:hypothetical protein